MRKVASFLGPALKEQCREIFRFRFFPQALENNMRVISNFFENSRRYLVVRCNTCINDTGGKFCRLYHWCCVVDNSGKFSAGVYDTRANNGNNIRLPTPKSELERKKFLCVNSTTQRCPKKIIKTFLIEDLFHLPPVSLIPVVHLELQIFRKFSKKFETAINIYSRAWWRWIREKTWSRKSRGTALLSFYAEISNKSVHTTSCKTHKTT